MSDFANATGLSAAGLSDGGSSMAVVGDTVGGAARQQIKAFVERIERVQEEIDAAKEGQKEIYAEAKSMGFDTKILRRVVALRKIDRAERQNSDALLELYLSCVEG